MIAVAACCGDASVHVAHDTGLYEPGHPRHHGGRPLRCPGVAACGHQNAGLEFELPADHAGRHAVATGFDSDGRVDDGVSWSSDHSRAAAHYSKLAAKATADARFQIGDRVSYAGDASRGILWHVVIETGALMWDNPAVVVFHPFTGKETIAETGLELVERAHYAPPDVTMIAMTLERITALEVVDGLMSASRAIDNDAAAPAAIRAMLDEVRGEVTRSPLIIDPELFVDLARHDREKRA